jgi:hypothetical protein
MLTGDFPTPMKAGFSGVPAQTHPPAKSPGAVGAIEMVFGAKRVQTLQYPTLDQKRVSIAQVQALHLSANPRKIY